MSNRLWAEVYTPAGNMLGIVSLVMAQVNRRLDAASEFTFRVPTSDENAVTLLQVWRRVRLFWDHPTKGKTRIGGGVLLSRQFADGAGSQETSWMGMDDLHELKRENTLRGLVYNNQSLAAVAADLVGNVAGWAVSVEAGLGSTSRRFDGQSILSALLTVAQGAGVHLRLDGERRIEIGAFGADAGLRITSIRQSAFDIPSETAIIERLSVLQDGNDIVNWVEPVWGSGDGVLTLARSTRSSPYTIQTTTGPNGRPVYYLSDASSISTYGTVKTVLSMADAPYLTSDTQINAANVLYDWAAAELARRSIPQVVYSISGLKLDRGLLPGDKVRLAYRGEVQRNGLPIRYEDIDTLLWVIQVTESYDVNGQRWALEVSNVDAQPMNDITLLADSLIAAQTERLASKLSATVSRYSDTDTLSRSTPISIAFEIPSVTVDVGQCLVRVTRTSGDPRVVGVIFDGVEVAGGQMWTVDDPDTFVVYFDEQLTDGTIIGDHSIEVQCLYGSGSVTVTVEVVEIAPTT